MAFCEIEMNHNPRKAHFDYFRAMENPYAGVTVPVDITQLFRQMKSNGLPFFLTVLYLAANAANAVPELRRRIRGAGVIEYENCPTSHTVALDDGTYCYCCLDCAGPFDVFLDYAKAEQARVRCAPSLDDGADSESLFFVSSLPWLHYTAIVQPTPRPADSNPRITFGRYEIQGERVLLPITLLVNHALADGKHMADFYGNFERMSGQLVKRGLIEPWER